MGWPRAKGLGPLKASCCCEGCLGEAKRGDWGEGCTNLGWWGGR